MTAMPHSSAWPSDDDPAAIAVAARIVMLSAASRTCHLASCNKPQETLLSLIPEVTELEQVRGQTFPTFLASAKARLHKVARALGIDGAVSETLADIIACPPTDVVGTVFDRLVDLASEAYEQPLMGQRLEPVFSRQTLCGKPYDRPLAVRGRVLRRSKVVEMVMYLDGFDLAALALIPRILAHELVCHIAARDTPGVRRDAAPSPFRDYFPDGFMDRAAWILLLRWLHGGAFPNVTPVGHLSVKELEYSAEKAKAFKAGIVAFDNCVVRTSAHVQPAETMDMDRYAYIRAVSEDKSIRAALALNACDEDIQRKDLFVHEAREDEMAEWFALVAAEGEEPKSLFEHLSS
jgi:hypothetical protein